MSEVDFQENKYNNFTSHKPVKEPRSSFLIKILLKTRVFKTETQASRGLVTIALLASLASIFLLYRLYSNQNFIGPLIPYENMTPAQKQQIPTKERAYLEKQALKK